MRSRRSRDGDDNGFISVEYMVAAGLSLIFLVMMTNFVVLQYGRAVVRASADEGARAGARVSGSALAACRDRGNDVLQGMKMAERATFDCAIGDGKVQATASATFEPWVPGIPTFTEHATAYSVKEEAP